MGIAVQVLTWAMAVAWAGVGDVRVDDYAARQGWVCTYGKVGSLCAGPSTFEGFDVQETVELCGEPLRLCSRSYKVALAKDDLAPALRFVEIAKETVPDGGWRRFQGTGFVAARRSATTRVVLALQADSVELTVADRPECKKETAQTALSAMVPLVRGRDMTTAWPSIQRYDPGLLDTYALGQARASVAQPLPGDDAERALTWSEPFACWVELHSKDDPFLSLRNVMAEVRDARVTEGRGDTKTRKKAEKMAEETANKHKDVVKEVEVDEVPTDTTPPADEGDDWP